MNYIKKIIFHAAKVFLPKWAKEELIIFRNMFVKNINNFNLYKDSVLNNKGVEIGGPSNIFQREIPVYRYLKSLDGVNYNINTIWEGSISEGINYLFYKRKPIGYQFISEATDMRKIDDQSYDFIISSNCLEHSTNPLKALREWRRIIKRNGSLILVLPKKDLNFDHKRKYTKFSTLLNAYKNNYDEANVNALDEILEHHDISRDGGIDNFEDFKTRSLNNFENRCLHHYVYSKDLIKEMLVSTDFRLVDVGETMYDYYALADRI